MSCDWIPVRRAERLKSFLHAGIFALAALLAVALASPAHTQTFDQAVSAACLAAGAGAGPCQGTSGTSSGSTTALTNESSPVEERRIQRLMGPFNVFMSGEYERFDKNITTFEPGYKTDIGRALVGADYSFSDSFLIGGGLKYGRDNGHFSGGGHFNTDSYGPLLHANFVPAPKYFIDASASYMRKNYSTTRHVFLINGGIPTPQGSTKSDTDGNEFKVGASGGYDFNFQNITVGPRLGLHYRRTNIDGYRERGSTGQELIYDPQRENSLRSVLGLYGSFAISTGFGVLVPQTTLEYEHEFQDPQRKIRFKLAGAPDVGKFSFKNDPPDRNYFNLGAGIVAVLPHGISPFLNYRALVGYNNQSSHIATAGLRVEF
jgi:outer membrane lipase/esterase